MFFSLPDLLFMKAFIFNGYSLEAVKIAIDRGNGINTEADAKLCVYQILHGIFNNDGELIPTVPNVGTTENRPTSPGQGESFFDTDVGGPIWYIAGAWKNAAGVEV